MKALKLHDGELFYQMKGSGSSLLLIHAGVADSRMWDAQFDYFAEHFCVVRCDLRGYGRSFLPDGSFAYHEDIRVLIEALELAPIWLMGASFGAQVAVDFTLAYPSQVKGLVLIAPVVSGFKPVKEVEKFNENEEALLEAGRLEDATELNLSMWVDGPYRAHDGVDPVIRKQVGEMQLHAFSHPEPDHVSLNRLNPPAIERLHEIQHPVLIISGALDVTEFVQLSELLAERIPTAKIIVVPGVAHMVSMEVPEKINQLVLEFVKA